MGEEDIYKNLGEVAYGFFISFLKEKQESVSNFFLKNKVGFIPPGMDYSEFQRIKTKTVFKQLKSLIGNHYSLSIILIGLYLSTLDSESKIKIIENNKQKVYDKYGPIGVSIMNLAQTRFIEGYVKWLSNYNIDKNPSEKELINFYEKILKDWGERSFFVQGVMTEKHVTDKIVSKINIGKDAFFIFASGNAAEMTKETISKLALDKFFEENNYSYSENNRNDPGEKVWIIEKIA